MLFADLRLIATDLDGTIVRPDGSVGDRTRAAFAGAAAAGLHVVIVTARPIRVLTSMLAGLGTSASVICGNGALVVDMDSGALHTHHVIDGPSAVELIARLRERFPGIAFAVETAEWFGREPHYVPGWPSPPGSPIDDALVLAGGGAYKLIAKHPELGVERLGELVELHSATATLTCSTHTGMLEIGPAGVSKGSTLAAYASSLGIDRTRVIAFGDMPNDIPMLEWAGIGVAVADAHPDVLERADIVTRSCAEEGVADVVEAVVDQLGGQVDDRQ